MCERRIARTQYLLLQKTREEEEVKKKIELCVSQIQQLKKVIKEQQLAKVNLVKSSILRHRQRQVVMLQEILHYEMERRLLLENLEEIREQIVHYQKELLILKRRELKFSHWLKQEKKGVVN